MKIVKKMRYLVWLLAAVMCFPAIAVGCSDNQGPTGGGGGEPIVPEPPTPPAPSKVLGIDTWVESSYVNVFRDFELEDDDARSVEFVTAKNEYESAQIVLRSTKAFKIEDVKFTDLTDGEHTIEKSNLKYNYVEYFRAVFNSPNVDASSLIREAPESYPDALSNEKTVEVDALDAQPIWVTLYVPKTTEAGTYTGKATVVTDKGDIDVEINAEVNNVTVPDSGSDDSRYNIIFWQLMIGGGFGKTYADQHSSDTVVKHFGCERWTEKWWKVVGDIADLMKENRLNTLYLPTVQLLLDGGSVYNEDGSWTFNFSKFDEYVQFFLDRGVVNRFMGYMMMTGGNTNCIIRDDDGRSCTGTIKFDSDQSDAWFDAYLPALYAHLHDKGWDTRWTQCLRDEPPTDAASVTQYKRLAEIYKRHMKEIPFGDPTQTNENSSMLLEMEAPTLIPLISIRNDHPTWYANLNENQRVYTYSCVVPQGSYFNRFIDMPVYYGRSIAWWNYNVGANGYLHWGLMAWYRPITDFALGDTATMYPDVDNNTVKSSIRMANLRDGAEEYELLKLLAENDPTSAKMLADMVAPDAKSDYCRDPAELAEVRTMLIRMLGGKSGIISKPESITLSETALTLTLMEDAKLTATVLPEDAISKDIVWSSSDAKIVTVNQNGEVWANAVGEAVITVVCKDYPNVKATATVTVSAPDPSKKVMIVPFKDAFVRGGQFADYRYGTSSYIDVCKSSANNTYNGYMTFDATGYNRGAAKVAIRIYASQIEKNTSRTIALYECSSDWSETTLSYNTAPANQKKIAELTVENNTGAVRTGWLEFDITEYFNQLESGVFTVCITDISNSGSDNNRVRLSTRESSLNRPTLVITGEDLDYSPAEMTGIEIDETLSLKVGERHTLQPTVLPDAAPRQRYSYASSDTTVATVSSTGDITALKAGSAKITVTSLDNPSISAECDVTVTEDERHKMFFATDDATIESHRADMNFGAQSSFLTNAQDPKRRAVIQFGISGLTKPAASVRLHLYVTLSGMSANNTFDVYVNNGTFSESTVTYGNAPKTSKKVGTYTVANPTSSIYGGVFDWIVVDIDPSCIAGDGTVSFTLVATSGDRVNFSSRNSNECPVLEIDYGEPITNITISDVEVGRPCQTVQLNPVVTPEVNHEPITYTSLDPEIATVDANGVVTAVSIGEATIEITSESGCIATCKVTVNNYINLEAFTLNKTELTLAPTASEQLSMGTCTPDNANWGMELDWESSDADVAYVSADGTVLGRLPGTAVITASSKQFPDVQATCTVTVQAAEHTAVFTPTQDAAVETHRVSTPGKGKELYLYDNPKRYSVIEFDVHDLPSAAVSIKLRLYVTNTFSTDSTVRVYFASDKQWDEATVNKDTAPTQTGNYLGSLKVGKATTNSWVDIAVNKSAVTGNGKVTFVLSQYDLTKGVYFSSKEGVNRPTLIVDYGVPVTDIVLNDMQVTVGLTYKVGTVTPAVNHEALYYTSSDETVATVNADGMLTALKAGTTTLTIKNTAETVVKTCTVTVTDEPGVHRLAPTLDATLNGSGTGTNYGTNNNLHTIKASNMHFLIMFDLSGIENITKLTLRMQLNNVGAPSQTLGLYYAPSTSVTESGVKYNTWNGTYGDKIMDYVVSGKVSGDIIEIEIDPAKLSGITDGKLGIVFKLEADSPDNARCSFWSKEETTNVKPMLVVETAPAVETQPEDDR